MKIFALAVKNNQASLMFLACLFVSLWSTMKIFALAVKNNQASLMFLARLFVSLPSEKYDDVL